MEIRRGIYWLPNLLTTAALFGGFYAIIAATKGHYEAAAIAIFIAMVMDTLDGRVARMTRTQSEFGAQYDSLSDLVSFGVAPALVVYHWSLHALNKWGWLAAFLYTVMTALRLARFNLSGKSDKQYFTGLPCPTAAAVISGLVWLGVDMEWKGTSGLPLILAVGLTLLSAFLMVSPFRYNSFKHLDSRQHIPFMALLGVAFGFAVVAIDPCKVLFAIFLTYAMSGPALRIRSRYWKVIRSRFSKKHEGQ